jgi:hypothetical protein
MRFVCIGNSPLDFLGIVKYSSNYDEDDSVQPKNASGVNQEAGSPQETDGRADSRTDSARY